MARVIAMLREARAAGLDVHRDGDALIVRGRRDQGSLARDLLAHKALVLAALQHLDECSGHERAKHDSAHVDWRLNDDGRLICSACRPEWVPADPDGLMHALVAAEVTGKPGQRVCMTCGSTGRCEGRLATTDGGWVCRDALARGIVRVNGQRSKDGGLAAG